MKNFTMSDKHFQSIILDAGPICLEHMGQLADWAEAKGLSPMFVLMMMKAAIELNLEANRSNIPLSDEEYNKLWVGMKKFVGENVDQIPDGPKPKMN